MENYKIKVNNESESKEVQELFFELDYEWKDSKMEIQGFWSKYCFYYTSNGVLLKVDSYNIFKSHDAKEITIQQLRDLVVLKRNSIDDATHLDSNKYDWYVANDEKHYRMQGDIWVYQPYIEGLDLKTIEKGVKMKEFLNPEQEYALVECFVGKTPIPKSWIEVPEGADIFLLDTSCGEDIFYFVKHDGEVFHEYYINTTDLKNNTWIKGTIKELYDGMGKVLWKRKHTKMIDSKDTTTQDKLKFIEKWLNGEKIQYILGIESEKTQWHNFTECAMQYIKRSDIKFREAPKYVTINGIKFKNIESILNYIKSDFDMLQ